MRFRKPLNELLLLLWILLLYQISQISCASIRNYSLKTVNFSVIQSDLSAPKNLSELIEFSPFNLPVEVENITTVHKETQETIPDVITLKLKTRVFVENNNKNKPDMLKTTVENNVLRANVSKSSLDDVEYLDSGEFWKWKLNKRQRRMNSLEEAEALLSNNPLTNDSSEEDSSENIESIYELVDSRENQISNPVRRSKYAMARQFLFHPYLPYGKDIPPDEKISFHDILPVKMVKFVKSMVEEAPWEQMFIKMVRMIVDQFVDKIIEKMFADKHDDGFKKRSFEIFFQPSFVLPNFKSPVVRLKRSVSSKASPEQDEDLFSFLPPRKIEQDITAEDKKSEDNRSWLDRFLDFAFPNTKSSEYDDEYFSRLRKRDTTNTQLLKRFLAFFINTFEKSSGILSDAKDIFRYKMLKDFLPFLYQKRYTSNNSSVSSNSIDEMKMSHRKFGNLERNDDLDNFSDRSSRSKRSTRARHSRLDEKRLWQSERHRSYNHRSYDVCSLRRACNAGRLLARLPSVQEITLQLQSDGDEPHWNALIWGMKKKRCSKIFCKRQRSPKGSRFSWSTDETSASSKKVEIVTESPPTTQFEEMDNNFDV